MSSQSRKPTLALPEPLRAAEIPSFTHHSVLVRLPDIARQTLTDNAFPPETVARVQALIDEIPGGLVRLPAGIPDELGWQEYARPFLGMNWLDIPWFFAEEYFYLRMVEAVDYFHSGAGFHQDPYARQKKLGLESTRGSAEQLAGEIEHALALPRASHPDSLARMLLADLWGNQNDLSMWPVQHNEVDGHSGGAPVLETPAAGAEQPAALDFLLSNDTPKLLDYLAGHDPASARIDIVLDNAGYELVADLALADFMLSAGLAQQVVLHTKCYPVFVSDALVEDIHATLDWLGQLPAPAARNMAARLNQQRSNGALRMGPHPFWTSPLPAWEMPADLAAEIAPARLLISKGDANYRRLLGDLHWPVSQPFASVVNYFQPAVLALRTLKSEIAVGIPAERVPAGDPRWMISGRYGLIQFATANA